MQNVITFMLDSLNIRLYVDIIDLLLLDTSFFYSICLALAIFCLTSHDQNRITFCVGRKTKLDATCYNFIKFVTVIRLGWGELQSTYWHITCIFVLSMPRRGCFWPNIYFQKFITFCVKRKLKLNEKCYIFYEDINRFITFLTMNCLFFSVKENPIIAHQ